MRDLRLLDPSLSTHYPAAVLIRDKAVVINLEYIRAIITAEYVLVLYTDEHNTLAFTEDLRKRLAVTPETAPSFPGTKQRKVVSPLFPYLMVYFWTNTPFLQCCSRLKSTAKH